MPFGMPSLGRTAIAAYTQAGARNPVDICYSGVYQLVVHHRYAHQQRPVCGGDVSAAGGGGDAVRRVAAFATPVSPQSGLVLKNAESRLNHHLAGLIGVSALAWTGHLVHVAIPESRGQHVGWDNFLRIRPHPEGLTPLFTGHWGVLCQKPRHGGSCV